MGGVAHHRAADAQGLSALRRVVEQGRERARLRRHRRDVALAVRHAARRIHEGARSAVGSGAPALCEAARLRAPEASREIRRDRAGDGADPGSPARQHLGAGLVEYLSARAAPPRADAGFSLTDILEKRKMPALDMVRAGERFYTSLGFAPLPKTFFERSLFLRPKDRDVVCHASAWDIDLLEDIRIKMCIERP